MIKRALWREYLRYILPTVLTFTLAGFYSIIDGVFVGQAVGDSGLAGINVAFPLVAFVMAVGTGIGMGGGVVSSIARGAGDYGKSQRAIGTTLLLLILASLPVMALLSFASAPLCDLLGGQGETLEQGSIYIGVIAWGVPFQVIVTGCIPLIRNQGKVNYAMGIQLLSGLVNITLNYTFVVQLGMGTAGAAWATVVSQFLAFILVVAFFARASNRVDLCFLYIDTSIARHIARLGLAPFGLTLLPEVTVVVMNINLAATGGEVALAAYAVVAYAAYGIQLVIQGVGDGSQPLISRYYGAKDHDCVCRLRNTNYLLTMSFGLIGLGVMFLLRNKISYLFGVSAEVSALVAIALPIFSISYIFYGFTHTSSAYFYATDNARVSSIVVYGEALLVLVIVSGIAALFGVEGIWWSITCVQILLSGVALLLLRMTRLERVRELR